MELLGDKTPRLNLHFSMLIIVGCIIQRIHSVESNTSTSGQYGQYHCIWYGECNVDNFIRHQNCPYTGTAKPLNDEGQRFLAKWCPDLMVDEGDGVKTCCDTAQLKTLDQNINLLAAFLERCPSCMHNFLKHVCQLTCAPDQSRFIDVTDVKTTKNETKYIKGIDYYISNNYISGTFNSCRQVSVPSTGQRALDLLCGSWGSLRCTPLRWFQFMGDAENNPYVPFQITYKNTSKPVGEFIPMNASILPCYQSVNSEKPACSCIDCEASCPAPNLIPTPDYYWREYTGDIPRDAILGGLDANGFAIYIGQVFDGSGVYPGQIRESEKSVIYYNSFEDSLTSANYVKILCGHHSEDFEWIKTNTSNIKNLTDKHLILGGYYVNTTYTVYIGRLSLDEESLVGMVLVGHPEQSGLHNSVDGLEYPLDSYEILSYNSKKSG